MSTPRLDALTIACLLLCASGSGCTQKPELQPLMEASLAKPPETMTVQIKKYQETKDRVFKHLFVSNFSVKIDQTKLEYSASRDGLTDLQKNGEGAPYGLSVGFVDSNSDGFSDLLMYLSGVSATNQLNLFCGSVLRNSSSNDAFTYSDSRLPGAPTQFLGLRDCEKTYLQLNPESFDNDKDGIPDYLELRAGLNPKNAGDADISIAGDPIPNIEKVKRNIPVDERGDSQPNQLFSYVYKTDFDATGARTFTISNIPVLNGGVDNFIAIYLTENEVATGQDYLFSAFVILKRNSAGGTLQFDFWGNSGSFTNQELIAP